MMSCDDVVVVVAFCGYDVSANVHHPQIQVKKLQN